MLSFRVVFLLCLWLCVIGSNQLVLAQLSIEITKIPIGTPQNTKIYLAGSFNKWKSDDERFIFQKNPDGKTYVIHLPDSLRKFEYKITRGSWDMTEGNFNGKARENRIFDMTQNGKIVSIIIESWEDFFHYTFMLKTLPKSTPHEAVLYVAGNFNDWNPGYPAHRLIKQKDGSYRLTIYSTLDKIEYKYTRGTWGSVEGRANGKALPNRVLNRKNPEHHILYDEIASWEDLSYKLSVYDLLLLFSAFQGILLIVALITIQDNNQKANQLLILLICVTTLALLSRVSTDYREVFQTFPKLILLPELVLFLYAPIFYFYIQNLLTIQHDFPRKWLHFIPFFLILVLYMPYFFMDKQRFIDKIVDRDMSGVFAAVGAFALLVNGYYWFICRQVIDTYKKQYSHTHSFEQNLQYLNTVIFIKGLCLGVWVFTCLGVIGGKILEINTLALVERSTDSIWLVFSVIPYFMGYFAMQQPEIFRLPQQVAFFNPADPLKTTITDDDIPRNLSENLMNQPVSIPQNELPIEHLEQDENVQMLKEKIDNFMKTQKPYINPKLTLNDMADSLQMNAYILSKIINEGFDKNFFDFINSYRIEEFKRLLELPKYQNYTLLSVAFEVGFNSKTAFNRSFKKLTNVTPSDYFQGIRGKNLVK
ncbi:MAG: helix-turn-helix domain-containing protein [Arcicella sp.]|jgi:AraC-like DNA-binding protein|nr:helix-turn-helix domain-containing protein [Arcicella sp.]